MRFLRSTFLFVLLLGAGQLFAQRIVYSEPEKEDTRRMNFDVVGKVSGNFLIYKNIRDKNYIAVYNNNMEQTGKEEHDYLPGERLINVDFFSYPDFSFMVYQFQKKNVVYCNAVKIDGNGKRISEIMELDTAHIGSSGSNNKVYSVTNSEDKSHILVYKINARNKTRYIVTTLLYNNQLALNKRSQMVIPMEENNNYLGDFVVDNDGDIVFTKFARNGNSNIGKTYFVYKPAESDSALMTDISQEKMFLDELHLKVDNANKRFVLTSFYYKQHKGNIDGMYFFVWDKASRNPVMNTAVVLGEELRQEAKGNANIKTAFNDNFIRDIIVKKDGGFIVGTEAYYTTSRYNSWNRWDYLYGSPAFYGYDYYSYSPFYSNWMWRNNRFNSGVRHHADNITILSFDKAGNLQWSNVIHKEQFDDESDDRISYELFNTGSQLHFIFNQEAKRAQLLSDYSIDPSGQISHNPPPRSMDRGYEFLPKYAKQVSSRQMIIPCFRNNYICFAKLDYNL